MAKVINIKNIFLRSREAFKINPKLYEISLKEIKTCYFGDNSIHLKPCCVTLIIVSMNIIFRFFAILLVIISQGALANAGTENQHFERKMQVIFVNSKKKTVKPVIGLNFSEVGLASWYGPGFCGRPTASGDIFNPNLMTAAHKYLPLNSMVKVTNLANNKSVKVLINDRGPYSKQNRIIDLSKKAAQELGFFSKGITDVKVEYLHGETINLSNSISSQKRNRLHNEIEKVSVKQWKKVIKSYK